MSHQYLTKKNMLILTFTLFYITGFFFVQKQIQIRYSEDFKIDYSVITETYLEELATDVSIVNTLEQLEDESMVVLSASNIELQTVGFNFGFWTYLLISAMLIILALLNIHKDSSNRKFFLFTAIIIAPLIVYLTNPVQAYTYSITEGDAIDILIADTYISYNPEASLDVYMVFEYKDSFMLDVVTTIEENQVGDKVYILEDSSRIEIILPEYLIINNY